MTHLRVSRIRITFSKSLRAQVSHFFWGNRRIQIGLSVWHEIGFSVLVVPEGLSVLVPQMITPVMMSLFIWKIPVSFKVSTEREAI